MKKYLISLMLLSVVNCYANEEEKVPAIEEPYNGFSFDLAPSAIGSDVGYLLRVGSPHVLENRTSFGLQFAQYLNQQQNLKSYYRFDLILSNRIYSTKKIAINFNSDVFYMFSSDLMQLGSLGLHYSTGAEVFTSRRVSLNTEIGWSLPFTIFNPNESNKSLGRGIALNLGVKFYL